MRFKVDSELSEEFEAKVGMLQGSVLSPFLFALVVDVITEFAREGALSELLYADDLVLISETIKGIMDRFLIWMEAFDSKGLKDNLRKTKVMVGSGITHDGLSESMVDPCGVCSLRVKANCVLCVQCGLWIHNRCVRVKWVTPKFSINFTCRKCGGNTGDEERLGVEMKTVMTFTYLGDRVSAGGGCEAAVTARTRFGWVMF